MKGVIMAKSDLIELEGVVTKVHPGTMFDVTVTLEDKGEMDIKAKLGGKLRQNHIKIVTGDKVTVSVSPYDVTNGIITWRYK